MGRLGILVTWNELTGAKPTKELLHTQLSPFSLQQVLLGLSRFSAQLNTWQDRHNARADIEATRQMLPSYYRSIERLVAANPDRVIFSRISILYVAKQALLVCGTDGIDVTTANHVEQIMKCCLMANDFLLAGRQPSPDDTTIEKAASLLPFSTYLPHADDPLEIARNLILVQDVSPRLQARSDYLDLRKQFLDVSGMTAQAYCEIVYCAATKFLTHLPEQNTPSGLILTSDYFRHTKVADVAARFLGEYSIGLLDLQQRVRNDSSKDGDFLLLQQYPLIEFAPDQRLCVDPGFLLDKAGRSFYWTLHAKTSPARQLHLLGYWATVVETYVGELAKHTYKGSGRIVRNPKFPNNDEACDLMVLEGTRLVLIEVKASTLTAKAKYSFDPELLSDELLRKAIEGTEGRRKGVKQVHETIRRFLNKEPINGVTADQVTVVYPLIVFLDKSFVSPYLTNLYVEHFDRKHFPRHPIITAPYAITISDLESVLPHTHRHDLADIIDDYYRHNRTRKGAIAFGSFRYGNIPLLKNEDPGKDPIDERFQRFCEEMITNTFPQPSSP